MALLLALGVLQVRADLEQLPPQLRRLRGGGQSVLERELRVPPCTHADLHRGHLRVDLPGLSGARLALESAPEVDQCLARAPHAPGGVQLREAEVSLVAVGPLINDTLQPSDRLLVPAGLRVELRQGGHGGGVARILRQAMFQGLHRLLAPPYLRACLAEAQPCGAVARLQPRGLGRESVGLVVLPGLEGDGGQARQRLAVTRVRRGDLLEQRPRLGGVPPLDADAREAHERLLVAGLRAQRQGVVPLGARVVPLPLQARREVAVQLVAEAGAVHGGRGSPAGILSNLPLRPAGGEQRTGRATKREGVVRAPRQGRLRGGQHLPPDRGAVAGRGAPLRAAQQCLQVLFPPPPGLLGAQVLHLWSPRRLRRPPAAGEVTRLAESSRLRGLARLQDVQHILGVDRAPML
mmetsp:Transcript_78961/g.229323  ORF Transcript_78961/g.229323 Transcript_78961/m.229323 type:complete len:407 (+) Transcript_78961:1269-2489(+)